MAGHALKILDSEQLRMKRVDPMELEVSLFMVSLDLSEIDANGN